ncbi:MAG: hypothetical protein JWL57_175 [Actinobacteria bacterium]|nr:hypothetical protein [Actinomycetota bacterium]
MSMNRRFFRARGTRFAAVAAAGALVMAGCSHKTANKSAAPSPSTPGVPAAPAVCPLTGKTPPSGSVPNRPALAIKMENSPESRPPTGLDTADIVYEEAVEGGITRFVVVYQCQDAARVEPVRSARLEDVDILSQFGKPLFGDAGGSPPTEAALTAAEKAGTLVRVSSFGSAGGAYHRDPARHNDVHSLYTSTQELYNRPEAKGLPAPKPVFTYAPSPTAGTPGATVHVNFSQYSDVVWKWDPASSTYKRYYGATPANDSAGKQISTTNVIVQSVPVTMSTFIEDPSGSHQPIATLIGSGAAYVCRVGTCVKGTWSRPSAADVTKYLDASGAPIPLAPGATWVELAPASVTGTGPIPVAQVTVGP